MSKLNPGIGKEILPAFCVFLAVIYAGVVRRLDVLVLSSGIAMICYGLKVPVYNSLLILAAATFLGAFMPFGMSTELVPMSTEGFTGSDNESKNNKKSTNTDNDESEEENDLEKFISSDADMEKKDDEEDNEEEIEKFDGEEAEEEEGFESGPRKKRSKKPAPPPDNGSRKEALELGKKYNIPSEDDDEDYHLDAGTTFLNAYKSLKPDQISAMTKDTQELINTQKQLMTTLSTLKPLITDGKQMMDTFQNYFGGQGLEGMGDLGKMAEKFISK
jgi:hypothetical protein